MKIKDLRSRSAEQLRSHLTEMKKELLKLQSKAAVGSLEKPGRIRQIKKEIAKVFTLLHEVRLS